MLDNHIIFFLEEKTVKKNEKILKEEAFAKACERKEDNGITELVFILDRSGSMSGLEADTIGGFNAMVNEQREKDGSVLVSAVLFDHERVVLYDRVDIDKVEPMTERDYVPRGSTALLDAIGCSIHHIGNVHRYARKEDVPEHTVFVITTDGMENASCMYSSAEIKEKIKRQSEVYGWEFLFLGANIDSFDVAGGLGIREDRIANYKYSSRGVGECYEAMSEAIVNVRQRKTNFNLNDVMEKTVKNKK
jgi:uncharacterized protein YegL